MPFQVDARSKSVLILYTCKLKNVFRVLELSTTTLSIGGVNDMDTILSRKNQVETHDFVGCLRSLRVDGIDLLWVSISNIISSKWNNKLNCKMLKLMFNS